MVRHARGSVLVLLAGTLLAACGSAAGATTAPAPTAAPTPISNPTTAPTPSADPTSAPSATIDPAADAPVTGTFHSDGTGKPFTVNLTASDPRVSGAATWDMLFQPSSDGVGAWVSGPMQLTNDGGSWDGSCRGGGWNGGFTDEMACWLAGSGGYDGLTYFQHMSVIVNKDAGGAAGSFGGDLYGVILPMPAPTP